MWHGFNPPRPTDPDQSCNTIFPCPNISRKPLNLSTLVVENATRCGVNVGQKECYIQTQEYQPECRAAATASQSGSPPITAHITPHFILNFQPLAHNLHQPLSLVVNMAFTQYSGRDWFSGEKGILQQRRELAQCIKLANILNGWNINT